MEIRAIQSEAEREACYRLRMAVFVDEQGVPPWEEMDADDETALHIAAIADGEIIGTARIVDKGNGIGKIGRVAVLREHRGKRAGRGLMEYLLDVSKDGYNLLVLDAQLSVIPFYENLGFEAEGEVFLDAGIEHRRMSLRLDRLRSYPA